jgi:hypothetical protein
MNIPKRFPAAAAGILFVLCHPLWADVLIEDFATGHGYPACCGEYGSYDSFVGNIAQNSTNSPLLITGTATDNGGFYHEGFGHVLWDFSGQTNLTILARAVPGNEALGLQVVLRDWADRMLLYNLSLSTLTTNETVPLTASLTSPDWIWGDGFDLSAITSIDVMGDYSDDERPLRIEIHGIAAIGPSTVRPRLRVEVSDDDLLLYWPTNQTDGFLLQSSTTIPGGWSDVDGSPTVVGEEYCFFFPLEDSNRFFRLSDTSIPAEEGLTSEGTAAVQTPPPTPGDSLLPIPGPTPSVPPPVLPGRPLPPPPPMPGASSMSSRVTVGMENNQDSAGALPSLQGMPGPYESFIDIGSYSGTSFHNNFTLAGHQVIWDWEMAYSLNFNDHSTNSTASFQEKNWNSHAAGASPPYPWSRTYSNYWAASYLSSWNRLTTNWPGGSRWTTYITNNSSTNVVGPQAVLRPVVPIAQIQGWTVNYSGGNTNSQGEPDWGLTYSCARSDAATLHLHVGTPHTNAPGVWYKWVLLSAGATNAVPAFSRDPASVNDTGSLAPTALDSVVSFSNMTLLNEALDANSKVFKQMIARTNVDVNPVVSGASNYFFDVKVVAHKIVPLTRAYHPAYEQPVNLASVPSLTNLQGLFNEGSKILAHDDDEKIPDEDPRVAPSDDPYSLYRRDDVPVYVEFRLSDGPTNLCCYNRRLLPVFPIGLYRLTYFNVLSMDDLDRIHATCSANVKQIRSINIQDYGEDIGGAAAQQSKSIILAECASSVTTIHEWGHLCGLAHRASSANPGPLEDGVMSTPTVFTNILRNEVNRFERNAMNAYTP